jgi:hypothetical protein
VQPVGVAKGTLMLSAYCPRHGSTVLYSPSSITGIRNTPLGIEVTIECYCGELIEVLSGASSAEPAVASAR